MPLMRKGTSKAALLMLRTVNDAGMPSFYNTALDFPGPKISNVPHSVLVTFTLNFDISRGDTITLGLPGWACLDSARC